MKKAGLFWFGILEVSDFDLLALLGAWSHTSWPEHILAKKCSTYSHVIGAVRMRRWWSHDSLQEHGLLTSH